MILELALKWYKNLGYYSPPRLVLDTDYSPKICEIYYRSKYN